jgi:predicted PurR-regulated permease PerM
VLAIGVGNLIAGPGGVVVMLLATAIVFARLTQDDVLPLPDSFVAGGRRAKMIEVRGSRSTVFPSLRSVIEFVAGALGVLLIAITMGLAVRAGVWIIIATMIAVALDRPTSFIERHSPLRRRGAVLFVITIGVALVGLVMLLGALNAAETTSEFSSGLPETVRDLETMPVIGNWLAERDAAVWLDEQMQDLPQRLAGGGDIVDQLPLIGTRMIDLLWTLLLAAVLLVDGPALAAGVRRRVPASHRRQAVQLSTVSLRAVSAYLGGAMVVASINASVVLVVSIIVGLALAPALAAWAFIWNFVPQIGGFMGGFPLVVLALTVGPLQAAFAAVVYVSYQFVENHVIQPKVIGEAIDVPAWVTLLAALAGGAMAGLLGAVVLTPLVGVIHLTARAIHQPDFPGRVAGSLPSAGVDIGVQERGPNVAQPG